MSPSINLHALPAFEDMWPVPCATWPSPKQDIYANCRTLSPSSSCIPSRPQHGIGLSSSTSPPGVALLCFILDLISHVRREHQLPWFFPLLPKGPLAYLWEWWSSRGFPHNLPTKFSPSSWVSRVLVGCCMLICGLPHFSIC